MRGAILASLAIATLAVSQCTDSGTQGGHSTAQNVLEMEAPPSESLHLTATDFVGEELCPQPESCVVTSATWAEGGESSEGMVVAVVRVFGDLPGYVTAGRPLDGGTAWRTDTHVSPNYCVTGPGIERVTCMVEGVEATGVSTVAWRILDTSSGETVYETEAQIAEVPPVVTQVEETIYALWPRQGTNGAFLGTAEALGPDGPLWSTEFEFELTDDSRTPGYILRDGDHLVVAEVVRDGERVTLNPANGSVGGGRAGIALADQSGRALGIDGGQLLVGDTVLDLEGLVEPGFSLPFAWTDGASVPVLVRHADGITAFSASSGEPVWGLDEAWDPLASCGRTLVMRSLSADDPGRLLAVDAETGGRLWSVAGLLTSVQSAWCAGEDVVIQDDVTLFARSLDDGAETWSFTATLVGDPESVMTLPLRPTYGSVPNIAWWVVTGDGSPGGVVVVR